MAKKKGISDAQLALYNLLQKEKFRRVPVGERAVFLPHCLRKAKSCRGETTEEGLACRHCSPDCPVNRLTNLAASKGYRCFVVPGGEMVFNIVEKYRPKAVLGVACHHEIGQAAERITGKESSVDFAYQGVPLSKSGCVDTKVDEEAVRAVLDLLPPPPGPAPSSAPSPSGAQSGHRGAGLRTWARRAAGATVTAAVALTAIMLLVPALVPPTPGPAVPGAPGIAFSSSPSVRFDRNADGDTIAELRVPVYNEGPGAARGVLVRATAYYCGRMFAPGGGGQETRLLNGTLAAGARTDVVLHVRVHSANDTSLLVETLVGGRVEASSYLRSAKPVFLCNAGVTGYTTTLVGGREANLSVQVFNDGLFRASGSLVLVAKSFSSFNKASHWDSEQLELPHSLGRNETWSASILVNVNELDPGHPSFTVELYEAAGGNPLDLMVLEG